jgi:manganese/zinc/iron transport system substrate-binding protein
VTSLMGPGVDPHLYKASEGDISKLNNALLIFYNGLNLEGRMSDILVKLARKKPTIAVSEKISEDLILDDYQGHADPHIWFDVALLIKAVEVVRDVLIEADPSRRAAYERNAAEYRKRLEELHSWAKAELAQIPKEQRVLVTAHDAFSYFGNAYEIEVVGLQGISTDAEYGLADIQRLVTLLVERKIKAVFVESSVPKRSIEAVVQGSNARGHQVVIGGELYSDAMGEEGTPEGTYIGMFRHNVLTIAKALK